MISRRTPRFHKAFEQLPPDVQESARTAFQLFMNDPTDPRLHLKQVHPTQPVYSARIGLHYRALALRSADEFTWFWIGSHADYDKLLKRR